MPAAQAGCLGLGIRWRAPWKDPGRVARYGGDVTSPEPPRFSVVIPAFNEAAYLAATLDSLAHQDFTGNYEVIVVDNNCTDDTARVAAAYGARVVAEPQQGTCQARQAGSAASRGEIIVSTDADTTFPTSWLSTIEAAFTRYPACVAVAGPCSFTDAPWWGRLYPLVLFTVVRLVALVTGRVCYVTATNLAFRRSAWDGYDTRLTQGGDELDILRRLRRHGPVVFLRGNATRTSARRLRRGLLYNVLVTFLYFYVLGYLVNRLARRPLLLTAPAFRTDRVARPRATGRRIGIVASGLGLAVVVAATPVGRVLGPGLEATFDALERLR